MIERRHKETQAQTLKRMRDTFEPFANWCNRRLNQRIANRAFRRGGPKHGKAKSKRA